MELLEGVVTVESVDDFVARLGAIGDEHGVTVQAFDASYVVDRAHLERAVELADRATDRGENVARDRSVEILCYAAGRRQIQRALTMGVSAGETPAVVLVDAGPDGESGDDDPEGSAGESASEAERETVAVVESMDVFDPQGTLGEYDPERVREFFEVGEAELAVVDGDLPALVHERVALLDVEK
jgi:KEOPS complex subunit Cgi121